MWDWSLSESLPEELFLLFSASQAGVLAMAEARHHNTFEHPFCILRRPEDGEMAKYGKSASKHVKSAVRRAKKGTLKSGSGQTVKSRKQAIAIGLSEAREKGGKVPAKKTQKKR